jgi:uncharacterized protein (DUF2236 family)
MWVHATLIESALAAHDALLGPLEPAERDRYYEESEVTVRTGEASAAFM